MTRTQALESRIASVRDSAAAAALSLDDSAPVLLSNDVSALAMAA